MNRSLKLGLLFLLFCVLPLASPWNGIPIKGKFKHLFGANLPWHNYGTDFGKNGWGHSGVSTKEGKINPLINKLKQASGNTVRWFLFCDGRAGITTNNNGEPTGLDGKVFDDIDAAIKIAKNHKIFINFVLFDFKALYKAEKVSGVQIYGRKSWFTSDLDKLMKNVVKPVLKKYGKEETILSWEIMNEPEWIISNLPEGSPHKEANTVTIKQFYNFAKEVSDAVYAHTKQFVTLGSASLKWYRIWTPFYANSKGLPDLNLSFYQTHYYSWMKGSPSHPDLGKVNMNPKEQKFKDLEIDKQIIVGEFKQSGTDEFNKFFNNGSAGSWAWSITADYAVSFSDMHAWAQHHNDAI